MEIVNSGQKIEVESKNLQRDYILRMSSFSNQTWKLSENQDLAIKCAEIKNVSTTLDWKLRGRLFENSSTNLKSL